MIGKVTAKGMWYTVDTGNSHWDYRPEWLEPA